MARAYVHDPPVQRASLIAAAEREARAARRGARAGWIAEPDPGWSRHRFSRDQPDQCVSEDRFEGR
jgi:hypothetical protein